jgi:PKD repeat protein
MKIFNKTLIISLVAAFFLLAGPRAKACTFKASFTGDSLVCSGSTINYVAKTTTGHYYRWVVKGGTVSSGAGTASLYILWAEPGTYSIKLIDSTSSCLDSLRKIVKVGLSGITLNNGAYIMNGSNASVSGKVYTVTTAGSNEYDAVWNKYQINLNKNFDFTFDTYQNGGADGMVFVIQNSGTASVTTSSSSKGGTYLGYYDQPSGSCDQSIGVELDIYNGGSALSGGYDSSDSHLSLVKNKDFTPLRPQINITSPKLGAGNTHKFRVTWNRDNNLYEVYYDGTKEFSWNTDIIKNIFSGNPNVWFGFTGGTGGSTALQTITTDTLIYGNPVITSKADTICAGDSVTLTASSGMLNYSWSNGAKTRSVKVGKTGTYSLVVTDSTLCSWTVTRNVVVVSRPTAAFTISNACQGQSLSITNSSTPSSNVNYLWKFSAKDSLTSKSPTYQYNTPGTYSVSLKTSQGACFNSISKSVTIYNAPLGSGFIKSTPFKGQYNAGTAAANDFVCINDTNVYEILAPSGLSNSNYGTKWVIKNINFATAYGTTIKDTATKFPTASKNASFSFYPKSNGDSIFILKITLRTLAGNCDSTITRYIKIRPKAVAGFTVSNVCQGMGLSIVNTSTPSSGVTYLWKFNTTDSSILKSPSYQYYIPGTYTMSLQVNNGGCMDIYSKSVTLYAAPLGSNFIKGSIFKGQFNAGDPVNPDYVCLNDTNIYQILPPKGFSNTDYGTKWIIKTLTFATPYGNASKDTATKLPTSGKNATFSFYPKSNGDTIYNLKIVLRTLPGNCDSVLYRTIKVRYKPVAKFGSTNACLGKGVAFKDSSTQSGLTGISNWLWNFGDNKTSTAQNPSHNYAVAGIYKVTFTALNDGGCGTTVSKSVEQYPLPKPKTGMPLLCQGTSLAFTDSSTIATGSITSWAWNFGDGNKSAKQNPTNVYAKSGPYNVKLVATSAKGCKDSVTKTIRVLPKPKAIFAYSKEECTGVSYYFANTSTDSTNANINKWDFGDGITSTAATGIHAFTKNGIYKVKLTVTSKVGCFDTLVQTVTPLAKPTVNFFFNAGCTGKTVAFIDSGKNGTKALYTWNYGDGSQPDQWKVITTTHAYNKAGSYKVKLLISPDAGCSDSETRTIVISDLPKVAYTATSVCTGNQTVFTNTSTTGTGSTYKWEFGDASSAVTTVNATHKYAKAGSYKAKLTVTNASGCSDSIRQTVNVSALPVVGKWAASVHNSTAKFIPADSTQSAYKWLFGTGDSSSGKKPSYTYPAPGSYYVRLFVTNAAGCTGSYSDSVKISKTGIAPISINKNNLIVYPNPFEGSTNITYTLSEKSNINISVFDMQGRLVAKIKEGRFEAGNYTDHFEASKNNMSEGVYMLKMVVNNEVFTSRIVNLK